MKTKEEIKDEVANSLIYASDWNGRITGWYHWNHYTMPSKTQYDLAYHEVIEKYASQFTSPIDTDKLRDKFESIGNDEISGNEAIRIIDESCLQYEKLLLHKINSMCEESLPPDCFDKWESVKEMLIKNRKGLK